MESVYEMCFYGGLILAILSLITAIILFVILKIPKVFGELTGRTEKKAIRDLKEGKGPEQSVSKVEQAKYYNQASGKITVRDAMSNEKRRANRDDTTDLLKPDMDAETKHEDMDATEILGAVKNADTRDTSDMDDTDEATDVLTSGDATDDDVTDVLTSGDATDDDVTDVLTSEDAIDDDVTDVLTSEDAIDDDATDVLTSGDTIDDDATDVLTSGDAIDDDATDVLTSEDATDDDATNVLTSDDASTTVLTRDMTDALTRRVRVRYNIVIVHTDEDL